MNDWLQSSNEVITHGGYNGGMTALQIVKIVKYYINIQCDKYKKKITIEILQNISNTFSNKKAFFFFSTALISFLSSNS